MKKMAWFKEKTENLKAWKTQAGIMGNSKRSTTDSENTREKSQKFIHSSAHCQKCSAIHVLALSIYLKSENTLIWVKFCTQNAILCVIVKLISPVLDALRGLCTAR